MTPEKLTFLQMFMASNKISDIYFVGEEWSTIIDYFYCYQRFNSDLISKLNFS